jgi:hypothetical protein
MSKPDLNQINIDSKITDIKAMSPADRASIIVAIRDDLRGYIYDTFNVSSAMSTVIDNVDELIFKEWGFGCSLALDNDNWSLTVAFPGEPPTGTARCTKTEQNVTGNAHFNSTTGVWTYEVEKHMAWEF